MKVELRRRFFFFSFSPFFFCILSSFRNFDFFFLGWLRIIEFLLGSDFLARS